MANIKQNSTDLEQHIIEVTNTKKVYRCVDRKQQHRTIHTSSWCKS